MTCPAAALPPHVPEVLTTTQRDPVTVAWHEAAHAVVALRTGTRFRAVAIDPPSHPQYLGILDFPKPPTSHAWAVVLCAGIVVDLQTGHSIEQDTGCDLEQLTALGPELAAETGRPAQEAIVAAFEEARRLLRRQHAAIRRVTVALLADGRLSYNEARRVAQLPGSAPGGARTPAAVGSR